MDNKEQALEIIDYIASSGHSMWEHVGNPKSIPLAYFQEKITTICHLIEEIGGTDVLKVALGNLTLEDYESKEWTA